MLPQAKEHQEPQMWGRDLLWSLQKECGLRVRTLLPLDHLSVCLTTDTLALNPGAASDSQGSQILSGCASLGASGHRHL